MMGSEKYSEVTSGVEITVIPEFLEDQSNIENRQYVFSYTIHIKNTRESAVQLINRHWVVISANRQIADVKGEGVVGEQPVLKSGGSFQYTSGTMIRDSIGAMMGAFTFVDDQGNFFDVAVPRFDLVHADSHVVH
jgi:ApaG protein